MNAAYAVANTATKKYGEACKQYCDQLIRNTAK